MVIASAPAVPLRRPRRLPPRLPLPPPAAGPGPVPTMMWLARCVLASTVQPRCCCAMAATRGSTCSALACASSARPLGTGTAQLVLDRLSTPRRRAPHLQIDAQPHPAPTFSSSPCSMHARPELRLARTAALHAAALLGSLRSSTSAARGRLEEQGAHGRRLGAGRRLPPCKPPACS
jgi:hypothetical protein